MHPYILIFGYPFSSYGLMVLIGCVVVMLMILIRCGIKGLRLDNSLFFFAFVVVGVFIGAKILYFIVNLPAALTNREVVFSSWSVAINFLFGGLVFYGGLIGGFVGAVCYAKYYHVNAVQIADNFIPAIPLFHAFGRIGCFLSGCCYGIEYHGHMSVTFTEALSSANGVPRLPIQLFEAGINVGIFVLLLVFERLRSKSMRYRPLQNFGLYLILYGIIRFFLEFLRGDAERGFFGPMTTSQWISLILIPIGIWVYCCKEDKNFIVRRFFNGDLEVGTSGQKEVLTTG